MIIKYINKFFKIVFISIINTYRIISPTLGAGKCRFTPTCSSYSKQAINKYGPFKGGYLAIKRILKCHPWGKYGYDPLD